MPSGHGERVVLRLLDKHAGRLDLGSLGMDRDTQDTIDELIHKPHGIILVTGPDRVRARRRRSTRRSSASTTTPATS